MVVKIDILTLIIIIGIIGQILGAGKKKQPPQRQNRPQGQQRPPQQPQIQPEQRRFKELLSEAQKNNRQDEAAKRARAAERRRIKELGKYAQPAPPLPAAQQPQIKRAAEGQSLMMPSPPQEQFVPTQSVTAIQPLTVIKDSEGSVWQTSFEREDIVRGLVMAEILGKPKALKR